MEKDIKRVEELDQRGLAEYIIDIAHRTFVHEVLWYREIEHQLGPERALEAMDRVWPMYSKRMVRKVCEALGVEENDGVPKALEEMDREKQLALIYKLSKNWLAQDGFWFQEVEFTEGMNDAKRCNDSTWTRFSPFEAHSIKTMLGLGEHPGLEGLELALNYRVYGRLNNQVSHFEDGALIFEMVKCKVQDKRVKKGLADYPCKSAGLVEYSTFAKAIDSRIKTECICCPPDELPEGCFCKWKFTINE